MASKRTVKEIQDKDKIAQIDRFFESALNAIQLIDLTKSDTRTFESYNKERLRTFMKNPKSNEAKLIALSHFLYMLSYPYRRLIWHYAKMLDFKAYLCTPKIDSLNVLDYDVEKAMNQTYQTAIEVRKMKMDLIMQPFLITAWREDCAFGYIYEDDTGFYIMPLDGRYCKVLSINKDDGTYNFAFDFSFFRSHEELLEYWDSEFSTKYEAYKKDSKLQWQELDETRTFCIKINSDDLTLKTPPFLSLFEQIIDLVDLQSIQNVKNKLDICKLLIARLKTRSNATSMNQWQVDTETNIAYYNRLIKDLPPEISAIIAPFDIESIDFKGNNTDDVDMLANSMSNLFASSGTAQILDTAHISGSTAFEASKIADSEIGLAILPQVEAFVIRHLTLTLGDEHANFRYIRVTPFTKQNKISAVQVAAQYGVPCKLEWAALLGYDIIDVKASQFLENDCLLLSQTWMPLRNSATLSSDSNIGLGSDVDASQGGRPQKDVTELSDNGDKTRWQDKNDK